MITPEVISSIASTVMATVVAVVALVFNYRQNVGWEPVVLTTDASMTGVSGLETRKFSITIEFWNRRKYPVALRHCRTSVSGLNIIDESMRHAQDSHIKNNQIYYNIGNIVEPNSSHKFDIEVSFEDQSLDAMRPLFNISVDVFDPRTSKTSKLRIAHKFFYPELGWKKSDDECKAAVEAFEKEKQRKLATELMGILQEAGLHDDHKGAARPL